MPSDLTLATQLRDAYTPLLRRLKRDRTISFGKSGILNRLAAHGPTTASELATSERITPQAVAMALRELEELDYVARVRDDVDRRKMRVEVTDQGRALLQSQRDAETSWLADAVRDRLDDGERAALAAAIPVLHTLLADDVDD